MDLINVWFPIDNVAGWASRAVAYFHQAVAFTHLGPCVYLDSYSWMARVYIESDEVVQFILTIFHVGAIQSYLQEPMTWIVTDSWHGNYLVHPTRLYLHTWHTLAVTFHSPTNTLTAWMDGTKAVSTLAHRVERMAHVQHELEIGME